jgi:hypothetical protein
MNRRYPTLSLLMAAVVTMAIPALASSVCACETGDTGVGIAPIDAGVARIVQDSPAFPGPTPGMEVIETGTPGDVTYRIAFLDRNGEADFEAPIAGLPNPQQLLAIEILRPDGSFVSDSDAIAVPASNGCTTQKVARTSATSASTSGTQPQVDGAEAGIAWILMDWVDAVASNGIVSCDFLVRYNSGAPTPIGVYTVRPGIITGILDEPAVSQGSVRLQPIGYGPSQDVTTTIYNLLAVTTTVGGAAGIIDFGTIRPGEIAMGSGIRWTGGNDVVVMNEEASQPLDMVISVVASDLVQGGTGMPDNVDVGEQGFNPTRTYAPITCDKVAIAMERPPNPGDAMLRAGGGFCQAKYFGVPTLFPGQQVALNAGLLEPGMASENYAFAAGRYVGTLEVCLMGPGGEGDPIIIGDPPINPIPSFNADLTQPVDEVGPAQSAA